MPRSEKVFRYEEHRANNASVLKTMLGMLGLLCSILAGPAVASTFPPPSAPEPDLLGQTCTYMGSGLTGGASQIRTDKEEEITLFDVSLTFQCRPLDPAADPATQKKYMDAVQTYADQLIYKNVTNDPEKCSVIGSQGSSGRLTTKPGDAESYRYFTDDLLVQYHASLMCRSLALQGNSKAP